MKYVIKKALTNKESTEKHLRIVIQSVYECLNSFSKAAELNDRNFSKCGYLKEQHSYSNEGMVEHYIFMKELHVENYETSLLKLKEYIDYLQQFQKKTENKFCLITENPLNL